MKRKRTHGHVLAWLGKRPGKGKEAQRHHQPMRRTQTSSPMLQHADDEPKGTHGSTTTSTITRPHTDSRTHAYAPFQCRRCLPCAQSTGRPKRKRRRRLLLLLLLHTCVSRSFFICGVCACSWMLMYGCMYDPLALVCICLYVRVKCLIMVVCACVSVCVY